jgi:hypothetical protein
MNFREKLPLTKAGQVYSTHLLLHPKMTTEGFAAIGPLCGELHLSGVRKTVNLQLTTFRNTGEL